MYAIFVNEILVYYRLHLTCWECGRGFQWIGSSYPFWELRAGASLWSPDDDYESARFSNILFKSMSVVNNVNSNVPNRQGCSIPIIRYVNILVSSSCNHNFSYKISNPKMSDIHLFWVVYELSDRVLQGQSNLNLLILI